MNRKKRIEYAAVSLCVFASGFVLYGLLGIMHPVVEMSRALSFILFGMVGGIFFGGIYTGIYMGVRFFAEKRLLLKIVAALFSPLTVLAVLGVGVVIHIPYGIYNAFKLISKSSVDEKRSR